MFPCLFHKLPCYEDHVDSPSTLPETTPEVRELPLLLLSTNDIEQS